VLRGGFGTPENGFTFRWKNHLRSQSCLGYPETIKQLELRLEHCHPANRAAVMEELARARNQQGPTVFDWLVEIIRFHGPGGDEHEDCVELVLE
jgi:hypothetical protein